MQINDHSKDALVLVPGFSPKLDPVASKLEKYGNRLRKSSNNPKGYAHVYSFETYDYKEYKELYVSIPKLSSELFKDLCGDDGWDLGENGKIDFVAHSMGGLIVREMVRKYYYRPKKRISFPRWQIARDAEGRKIRDEKGRIKYSHWVEPSSKKEEKSLVKTNSRVGTIGNIVTIATPNKGTLFGDKIPYNPFLKAFAWCFGKISRIYDNEQAKGVRIGNQPVFNKWLQWLCKETSPKNDFLDKLNEEQIFEDFKLVTIAASKWTGQRLFLIPPLIHGRTINDGLVERDRAALEGAINIIDENWKDCRWNHDETEDCDEICNLLYAILFENWVL